MDVDKSRDGDGIKASLDKIVEKTGDAPVYGLSDNGPNLNKGFELAGIPRHRDISHTFGSIPKNTYDEALDFKGLVGQIGKARKWTLTDCAVLMPPNMRSLVLLIASVVCMGFYANAQTASGTCKLPGTYDYVNVDYYESDGHLAVSNQSGMRLTQLRITVKCTITYEVKNYSTNQYETKTKTVTVCDKN